MGIITKEGQPRGASKMQCFATFSSYSCCCCQWRSCET